MRHFSTLKRVYEQTPAGLQHKPRDILQYFYLSPCSFSVMYLAKTARRLFFSLPNLCAVKHNRSLCFYTLFFSYFSLSLSLILLLFPLSISVSVSSLVLCQRKQKRKLNTCLDLRNAFPWIKLGGIVFLHDYPNMLQLFFWVLVFIWHHSLT